MADWRLNFLPRVLFAGLGGLIGLAIAQLGVRALVQAAPIDLPRLDEVHVDAGILQAAIVIVAVTAVVVGLLPAVRVFRTSL